MKTKNILLTLITVSFLSFPAFSNEKPARSNTNEMVAREKVLEERLNTIDAMDIKSMSKTEKKALRSEVKDIQKEMKQMANGGLYISVGGLIIILLLLIILL